MSENKLVAIVNGKEISRHDVLKFLNDIGPQMAMQFQSPEGIKRVIDELVNQELLYLDAKETKLEESEEFKAILESTKINLLKNFALNNVISEVEANEEEIVNFYNENKVNFQKPESVVASHILLDSEEKAIEIIEEINNGLSFEDAAKNYSSCPSKEVGGNLGEFTKGQMVPEFETAAFEMETGAISSPIKTQFGYHIIKLIKKNEALESSLEEVKDEVYNQVILIKQQNEYINKINNLKEKYEVQLF